ncbi:PssE/Cps14G family polysaccharide biosynthesis glycosyltransferase [Enterococcus hirae]|uniref:PssE/Cps14G family polysaccharide biosynthesis glycosyltransferase n=1 Tax=Enterococcus hirae TaxID=1354 RepID=UPI001897C6F6|nr:PssE/Cps14G family polysaccharide biosynthesis glycosyltransferase [Enterococcus hirae]
MIFVTVGTHEQQFDRLIKEIDRLKESRLISEEIFMQTGFCNYIPKACDFEQFLSYEQMEEYIDRARLVITHGGPSTFMNVLKKGKKPIVVPRQKRFSEHVNDHQLEFAEAVKKKGYDIYVLKEINELLNLLNNSKNDVEIKVSSNNLEFCEKLESIVNSLDIK